MLTAESLKYVEKCIDTHANTNQPWHTHQSNTFQHTANTERCQQHVGTVVKHALNHMPKQPHTAHTSVWLLLLFRMVLVTFLPTVQEGPTSILKLAAQWR